MGFGTVELVLDVEKAFNISIPDEDADRLQTVGAMIDYVHARVEPPRTRDEIASRLRQLAWEAAGRGSKARTPDEVTDEMSFVNDLDY